MSILTLLFIALFIPVVYRVIIHVVAQCHEEGLESHLRSYVKYAYKAEPYVASEYKTVHEELTKSMTTILKPSADFLTSNKLLKVCPGRCDSAVFKLTKENSSSSA